MGGWDKKLPAPSPIGGDKKKNSLDMLPPKALRDGLRLLGRYKLEQVFRATGYAGAMIKIHAAKQKEAAGTAHTGPAVSPATPAAAGGVALDPVTEAGARLEGASAVSQPEPAASLVAPAPVPTSSSAPVERGAIPEDGLLTPNFDEPAGPLGSPTAGTATGGGAEEHSSMPGGSTEAEHRVPEGGMLAEDRLLIPSFAAPPATAADGSPAATAPRGEETDAEAVRPPLEPRAVAAHPHHRHIDPDRYHELHRDDWVQECRRQVGGIFDGPGGAGIDAHKVRAFQARHGLRVDGLIGPHTIDAAAAFLARPGKVGHAVEKQAPAPADSPALGKEAEHQVKETRAALRLHVVNAAKAVSVGALLFQKAVDNMAEKRLKKKIGGALLEKSKDAIVGKIAEMFKEGLIEASDLSKEIASHADFAFGIAKGTISEIIEAKKELDGIQAAGVIRDSLIETMYFFESDLTKLVDTLPPTRILAVHGLLVGLGHAKDDADGDWKVGDDSAEKNHTHSSKRAVTIEFQLNIKDGLREWAMTKLLGLPAADTVASEEYARAALASFQAVLRSCLPVSEAVDAIQERLAHPHQDEDAISEAERGLGPHFQADLTRDRVMRARVKGL